MQEYLAVLTIILLLGMVLFRAAMLNISGTKCIHFGNIDKSDYLIVPFAFFFFYTILAGTLEWPNITNELLFHSKNISWFAVSLCFIGLVVMLLSLISFGKSFRIGIDMANPDKLITTGIYGRSRNPIYVAFILILIGQFLIFPNWILLCYLAGGLWLIHRQILREEAFMGQHYGQEYVEYCNNARRYI